MATVVALKQPALKPQGPSFGEALKQTATSEPKGQKKGKMPTIQATEEVKQAVDEHMEAKTTYKMAEATLDHTGQVIVDFVRQVQDQEGFAGRYQGSYAVMGNTHQAKVIFANKFSINSDDKGDLAAILGDHYELLINERYSVKLKDAVFADEVLQAELMELVGDRFGDFFETQTKVEVCDNFSQIIYTVLDEEQLGNLRTFARQYKPSIR
jgi:hypothetical protein